MRVEGGPPRRPAWLYPAGTIVDRKNGERWMVKLGWVDGDKYWDRVK